MKSSTKKIIDKLRESIREDEREPIGAFLEHIKRQVIPLERQELEEGGVPDILLKSATAFRLRYDVVKRTGQFLSTLLGDFWERQFCLLVSDWGCHTYRTQKHKVTHSACAGIGNPKIDHSRDIKLPDILLFGNGKLAWCDIKHLFATRYNTFSIELDDWTNRLKLSRYSNIPQFYIIHTHSEPGKSSIDKWSIDNDLDDWIGIQLQENMPFEYVNYLKSASFKKLTELLADFMEKNDDNRVG